MLNSRTVVLAAGLAWFALQAATAAALPQPGSLYPAALAATPDGTRLFIACATANEVAVFDFGQRYGHQANLRATHTFRTGRLARDGARLYVTCAAPKSSVRVLDTGSGKVLAILTAGHTATAPVLSPNRKSLFVCNRFNNDL